ncbi:MAG: CheB methylesterase domain-containing protein, partial [Tistlia sp.]
APGDRHMRVEPVAGGARLRIDQGPPENFCRPSADPMLRSLAAVYGARLLTVILTGMGADGLKGCQEVVAAGGGVIAQDEASSVVWGMPGAVATNGLCHAVLPLDRIADHLKPLLARSAA